MFNRKLKRQIAEMDQEIRVLKINRDELMKFKWSVENPPRFPVGIKNVYGVPITGARVVRGMTWFDRTTDYYYLYTIFDEADKRTLEVSESVLAKMIAKRK